MPIQVGEQPHGKSDPLYHCKIGGPLNFWQEPVEEAALGQKVHALAGELNTGYKLQNFFLDWRRNEVRRHLYHHQRRLDGKPLILHQPRHTQQQIGCRSE
jgi:hypothetical protein